MTPGVRARPSGQTCFYTESNAVALQSRISPNIHLKALKSDYRILTGQTTKASATCFLKKLGHE